MTPLAELFLRVMREHPGKLKAIRRAAVLEWMRAGGRFPDLTDEKMRLCKEEVLEAGHLVGCGQRGYYMIETIAEAQEVAGYLEAKGRDLLHKASLLKRNAAAKWGGDWQASPLAQAAQGEAS